MGLTKGQAFPSKYMSKDDVMQGPRRFTIKDMLMETIKGDGGEEDKAVMYFREPDSKPMIVNQTNWITLEEAYGADTDGWANKPVEVYHDPGIMFGGKRTGGTRLRIPSGAPVTAPAAAKPAPAGLAFAAAVALAASYNVTKEQLVAALKARGLAGYNAARDEAAVREIIASYQAPAEAGFDEPANDASPTEDQIPF